MEPRRFYRLADVSDQGRGLWYSINGEFTGLIHGEFNFCVNHSLVMPFDPDLVGWLSVSDTLEGLFWWFSKEDIAKLEPHGFRIAVYEATNFREYRNHWLIDQENSILVQTLLLESVSIVETKLAG